MTLDETIKEAKITAAVYEKEAHKYTQHGGSFYEEKAKVFRESAKEFEQIAEWLEELKAYRVADRPTKVYAVTEGEYSDYGICAMFSDRSKAIEYIERHARRDASCEYRYTGPYYIEEYDLNQEKALGKIRMFCVKEPFVGGVLSIKETDTIDYWGSRGLNVKITNYDDPDKRTVEGRFETTIFAKDEEHALKIAYDKRAKLAAQILIDGYGARID